MRPGNDDSKLSLYIILAILIWAGSGYFIYFRLDDWGDRGTFGDMFGAINALFSGLSLGGVAYTVYLQKSTFNQQSFESKFFQLMSLHHQIVRSIEEKDRDLFENISKQIKEAVDHTEEKLRTTITKEKLVNYYEVNYNIYSSMLGHYFRNLYHFFRFIDKSNEISDEQKHEYSKIVRAQLSTYEIVLLAYNGLTEVGKDFRNLYINKYKLLKNMNINGYFAGKEILRQNYSHLDEEWKLLEKGKNIHNV